MPKILPIFPRPKSDKIDLTYIANGVIDNISGTKIVADGDTVTLTAGTHKTLTRVQAHTLFYAFLLLTGWDDVEKKTR